MSKPLAFKLDARIWPTLALLLSAVHAGCAGYAAQPTSQSTSPSGGSPQISTSVLPGAQATVLYSSTLVATGGTTPYTWSLSSGSLPAGLSLAASSGIISGTPTTVGTSSFVAQVTDAASKSATQSLSITIAAAPVSLGISTTSLASGSTSVAYSQTLQATGGTSPYVWSINSGALPTGLALARSTGVIAGTPSASGTFSFVAVVADSANHAATQSLSITIAAAPSNLSIQTSGLSQGVTNSAYSQTLQVSGGTSPYTWSIISGSLPGGLALTDYSGLISGTPTQTGTFPITFQVADSASHTASAAFSLVVTAGAPALGISTSSLSQGTTGTAYSQTLAASGGVSPYTWSVSSGSLPPGLSLTASSGLISGTPTQAGTYTPTFEVVDSASNNSSKIIDITIAQGPPATLVISTTSLPQASTSSAYSEALSATGGTSPYTWTISSGSLPSGLTLSTAGVITGTASSTGSSSFTAKVTDSESPAKTATQSLSIVVVAGVALDQYGGRTDIKCANTTGWFHAEEINSHWWLCTPLGNAFYMQGVAEQPGTIHGTWDPASVNKRVQSWGFNTVIDYSYLYDAPFLTDSNFPADSLGLHTNPVKMPFFFNVRPAFYSMRNPAIGSAPLIVNPVKNMLFVHSPYFTGYASPNGNADYYDSGLAAWLNADLKSPSDIWGTMASSPYLNYAIGLASDDGDELNGFSAGPDFVTDPPSHNNFNLGMQIAAMSPLETANNTNVSFVYRNTQIYSKLAWRGYIAGKYGTVTALNSAWGSNYTTFDSSGTCVGDQPITCASSVSADSVGAGNGANLTFSTILTHTTVSHFSLQVLVGGTPVAGDLGNGNLWGPNLSSGTINYSTGALSITFTSGGAPASGTAITATYVANGWQLGTGLLDEDGRPSHQGWIGSDWIALSNANAATAADFNTFFQQVAVQYFSTCRSAFKAIFPNLMYLGPDSLTSWGVPAPAPVLKAASQYIDAFISSGAADLFTQPEMDFIEANWGNKPYFGSFYTAANPDSALAAYTNGIGSSGVFATQATRAQAYYSAQAAQLTTAHTTSGNYPYIGMYWFDYVDLPGEQLDWGLTTPSDNAYDGHEPAAGSVSCSAPISTYTCGGEPAPGGAAVRPFGNLIGGGQGVAAANALWLGPIQ